MAHRVRRSRFPFDHLSLAEVAERDRLREKRRKGPLEIGDAVRLAKLDRQSRPPLYGPVPRGTNPPSAA